MENFEVVAKKNGNVIAKTNTTKEGVPAIINEFSKLISKEEANDKLVSFSVSAKQLN